MINKKTLQIIGCFATEYSLAKLNRNLAIALDKIQDEYDVSLWGNSEILDRLPTEKDFHHYPELKILYHPNKRHTDIAIYNNFPKSLSGSYGTENIDADLRFGYLAWEETVFPKKWINEINKNLHGMFVTSEHTAQILRKSGISIPVKNIGVGTDHYSISKNKEYKIKTNKNFKFLHISSGHYRKGIDVLLKAYVNEFSNKDDVCLILKIFTNSNSILDEVLKEVEKIKPESEMPEILLINDNNLTDDEMTGLYKQSDSIVLPTRAEGFGMPMAEAFMFKKPLITTGYSGHLDFCNNENSLLIDYKLIESKSHHGYPGSMVAEPDQNDLKHKMRYVYENIKSDEVQNLVSKALETSKKITWGNTAIKVLENIKISKPLSDLKIQKLFVLSTINNRCGVAIYTKELYFPIISAFSDFKIISNIDVADRVCDDQSFVVRTWKYGESDWTKTLDVLKEFKPDYLHIQYNFSDYSIDMLGRLIEESNKLDIKTLLTLHSVDKSFAVITSALNSTEMIFVHSDNDLDTLQKIGLKKVNKFLYGVNKYNDTPKSLLRNSLEIKSNPIIASHGLIHEKKGLCELIKAVALLKRTYPDILYLAVDALNVNNITSTATYKRMLRLIQENNLDNNVLIITDFIKDIEVIRMLQIADLIVLPYAELKEGASGALRASFAAHRPVIITDSYIFSNIKDAGYRIDDNNPIKIFDAVKTLLQNSSLYQSELTKVNNYIEYNSWEKSIEKYFTFIN